MGDGVKGLSSWLRNYFGSDIWTTDLGELTPVARRIHGFSRWFYLVIKGFLGDQCIIRASALTFTTVLSIVPFLAVGFSIAKGFGLQNATFIRDLLMRVTADRMDVVDNILGYIDNTNVSTLGWVGVGSLLIMVFSMVSTIETAFNTIWNVKKGRTFWRKFTDFFSVILVFPLIILLASSLNVTFQEYLINVPGIGYVTKVALKLTPFIMLFVAFTFIYAFIPNTRVRLSSAALGGMVAGTLWQLAQWAYIGWQIGFKNYNAIYGSFAQLPLFLIWMYISWIIVLFGAEVSYAVQHVKTFREQKMMANVSLSVRRKLAVLILSVISARFLESKQPPSLEEIALRLKVPEALLSDVMHGLTSAGVTIQAENHDGQVFYLAVPPDKVRVTDVLTASAVSDGVQTEMGELSRNFCFIDSMFDDLEQAAGGSDSNLTLAGCAERLNQAEETGITCGVSDDHSTNT